MFHSENSILTILFTLTYTQIQKKAFHDHLTNPKKKILEKNYYIYCYGE